MVIKIIYLISSKTFKWFFIEALNVYFLSVQKEFINNFKDSW